jgi:hypothetical protein
MKFALEALRPPLFPSAGTPSERVNPAQVAGRTRLASIDLLRGLVMVVMATFSQRVVSIRATSPTRHCF